jgi:hypothetical protein
LKALQPKHEQTWLKRIVTTLVAALVIVGVWAHITHPSDQLTGPVALFDHVFDVALALGLSILSIMVGYSIFTWAKLQFAGSTEALTFSFFAGTGVLGLSVLGLGLVGLLRPLPVLAVISIWILLTVRQ